MGTEEQVQEALQRLQAQEARIAALEAQLPIESARAQTAEQERSALIQTLVTIRQDRAGGMVKSKGKGKKGSAGSGKVNTGQDHRNNVECWSCGRTGHYGRDCRDNWSEEKATGKSKSKEQDKGKLRSVEGSSWQGRWCASFHREQRVRPHQVT